MVASPIPLAARFARRQGGLTVLDLFEMSEPADDPVRGHDLINLQRGVVEPAPRGVVQPLSAE
jgi:hypothetical protein